jgi:hypothetical protein
MVGIFNSSLGGGGVWGEAAIEHWTLDSVTPHQGGVDGLDPKRVEGLIKICFMVIVIKV